MPGHGLQYTTGPGGLSYSPARDLAYNYPQMIASCVRCFNIEYWPELIARLVDVTGDTEEEVIAEIEKAQIAQLEFLKICCENPEEDIADIYERSGWNAVSPEAQLGWTAMMGQVIMGQVFVGLRDITAAGDGVRSPLQGLLNGLSESRRALNGIDADDEHKSALGKVRVAIQAAMDCGVGAIVLENAFKAAIQPTQL